MATFTKQDVEDCFAVLKLTKKDKTLEYTKLRAWWMLHEHFTDKQYYNLLKLATNCIGEMDGNI